MSDIRVNAFASIFKPEFKIPFLVVITITPFADLAPHIEAAAASLRSEGWTVHNLGDMSDSINVLFDLDLQKLLSKVWKDKNGIMIVSVLSDTEEGLNFFADAVNSLKEKVGKNLYLALCGKTDKKLTIAADLLSDNFEDIVQWSETVFESHET